MVAQQVSQLEFLLPWCQAFLLRRTAWGVIWRVGAGEFGIVLLEFPFPSYHGSLPSFLPSFLSFALLELASFPPYHSSCLPAAGMVGRPETKATMLLSLLCLEHFVLPPRPDASRFDFFSTRRWRCRRARATCVSLLRLDRADPVLSVARSENRGRRAAKDGGGRSIEGSRPFRLHRMRLICCSPGKGCFRMLGGGFCCLQHLWRETSGG